MSYSRINRDSLIYVDRTTLEKLAKAKGVVDDSFTLLDDRCPCMEQPEGSYSKNELVYKLIDAYKTERADAMAENAELKSRIQCSSDEMASLNETHKIALAEYRRLKMQMYEETPERDAALTRVEEIAATQLKEFFDRNGELFETREKLRFKLMLVHDTLAKIDESWGIPLYLNVEY